jgi:hypothetical protein
MGTFAGGFQATVQPHDVRAFKLTTDARSNYDA